MRGAGWEPLPVKEKAEKEDGEEEAQEGKSNHACRVSAMFRQGAAIKPVPMHCSCMQASPKEFLKEPFPNISGNGSLRNSFYSGDVFWDRSLQSHKYLQFDCGSDPTLL